MVPCTGDRRLNSLWEGFTEASGRALLQGAGGGCRLPPWDTQLPKTWARALSDIEARDGLSPAPLHTPRLLSALFLIHLSSRGQGAWFRIPLPWMAFTANCTWRMLGSRARERSLCSDSPPLASPSLPSSNRQHPEIALGLRLFRNVKASISQ